MWSPSGIAFHEHAQTIEGGIATAATHAAWCLPDRRIDSAAGGHAVGIGRIADDHPAGKDERQTVRSQPVLPGRGNRPARGAGGDSDWNVEPVASGVHYRGCYFCPATFTPASF